MTPLEAVLVELQAQMETLRAAGPAAGSSEWYRLRAVIIGLSYLRRLTELELTADPGAADLVYRAANRTFKTADVATQLEEATPK
tara:strand:- start:3837 stop:4091 length:255 start_codon:yes stop_codon:yes gene_type:complete